MNPYHYERVEEIQIPPVLVPRYPPAHFANVNFEGKLFTVNHFTVNNFEVKNHILALQKQNTFNQDDFIIPNNLNFNDLCQQYPPQVR